jgi:hypothetical protein
MSLLTLKVSGRTHNAEWTQRHVAVKRYRVIAGRLC